jgi:hypothetical protein
MRYIEFRDSIHGYLRLHPEGATWKELKSKLRLSYKIPCPTWVHRLEEETGLSRSSGPHGKVWRLVPGKQKRRAYSGGTRPT